MSESFSNAIGQQIIVDMAAAIKKNAALLTEVDGKIGDGDHGINMDKGFSMCVERLTGAGAAAGAGAPGGFSDSLKTLGRVLLGEIGGSMGPLYGTFFNEMAKVSRDHDVVDAELFGRMLDRALAAVSALGNAKAGDKTMLDALIPAVGAFKDATGSGASFSSALRAMAAAAERGKEATRDMVAQMGRSARLGERSRGVLDAGATSCSILLGAMAESMSALMAR